MRLLTLAFLAAIMTVAFAVPIQAQTPTPEPVYCQTYDLVAGSYPSWPTVTFYGTLTSSGLLGSVTGSPIVRYATWQLDFPSNVIVTKISTSVSSGLNYSVAAYAGINAYDLRSAWYNIGAGSNTYTVHGSYTANVVHGTLGTQWGYNIETLEANPTVFITGFEVCWQGASPPTPTPTTTPTATPESVNALFTYSCNPCTAPALFQFTNQSTGATSYSWDFGNGSTSSATSPSMVFVNIQVYTVTLTATGPGGTDTYSMDISVNGAGIVGGSLFRPLQPEDEENIFEGGGLDLRLDPEVVAAISYRPYKPVFAVAGGVVESVRPLTDCGGGTNLIQGGCTANGYEYNQREVFKVRVSYDTGRVIEYMVADAELYVRPGQEIRAGCIIGATLTATVSIGGAFTVDSAGIALIRLVDAVTGQPEELLSNLIVPPRESSACNVDPLNASCIGDPNFGRLQWSIGGNAQFDGDGNGITLQRGGYAQAVIRLSPLLAYSVRVNVSGATRGSSLLVQIGETVEEFVININTTSVVLQPQVHESDRGDGSYTIRLENTGTGGFRLDTNCIARGIPSTLPGFCLFKNYSFDQELANWQTSGGVFAEARGEVLLEDGGTISQQVELYPDGASSYDYELQVTVRAMGFPNQETNETDTIQIEWRHGTSGSWNQMSAPVPVADFFGNQVDNVTYFSGNAIRFSAMIPVAAYANDVIQIRAQIVRSGSLGLVGISEVCINDDFDTFPDATGGGLGGIQPPLGYTCNVVTRPNTSDIGAWITYLWSSLDRFFQCDLMRAINTIIELGAQTLDYLYWSQIYAQASMVRTIEWIKNDLIPWVNAHFNNIVLARGGVASGGSCSDLFCLLTTLINAVVSLLQPLVNAVGAIVGALTQGVTLLFDLVGALLNLFVLLITQIFNLFNQVRDLLSRFVTAWNTATPTPIPGVPVCNADPRSSPTCMVFWFVDNTILSGRGALIVPVIIGVAAANLILWAIKKLRDGLSETARAA